jgi:hypothetical protein
MSQAADAFVCVCACACACACHGAFVCVCAPVVSVVVVVFCLSCCRSSPEVGGHTTACRRKRSRRPTPRQRRPSDADPAPAPLRGRALGECASQPLAEGNSCNVTLAFWISLSFVF